MRVSLNEVQATAAKAASGRGIQYGEAVELGQATRWLCERGLRGVDKLAHALHEDRAAGVRILDEGAHLTLTCDADCLPIAHTAAAIRDTALLAQSRGLELRLGCASHPLLLLAVLDDVSTSTGRLTATWSTIDGAWCEMRVHDHQTEIGAPTTMVLLQAEATDVVVSFGVPVATEGPTLIGHEQFRRRVDASRADGVEVGERPWAALQEWAAETYVPASNASRESGAGAGLTDND